MTSNKKVKYVIPLLAVLVAFGVALFFRDFRTSVTPRHWLADLQYSHIAITDHFQTGEGTLFKPKSYNLSPKGGGSNQKCDGLAEARFPLLNYLIAKISNDQESQIYAWRLFSFIFYLLAVAVSVLLMFELCKNWWLSFIVGLAVNFTSVAFFALHAVGPYTLTYLLVLASFYSVFLYHNRKDFKFLFLALILSGWAALQGHGTIVFFLVILGNYGFRFYKSQHDQKVVSKVIVLSLVVFALFFYQRVILLSQNGGLFELNDAFSGGLKGFFKANSRYLFFNSYGVSNSFISAVIFVGLLSFLFNKYIKKGESIIEHEKAWMILLLILLNVVYYIAYVASLVRFDFYALELMTPVLALAAMYGVTVIHENSLLKKVPFIGGLVALFFISLGSTCLGYQGRFVETEENRVQKTLDNLKYSDDFLDSLGVSLDEKISYINLGGDNIPMMMTNRKGYTINGVSSKDFKEVLSHSDSRYILSQDQFFMYDVVNEYPEILTKLKLVATDENLSLYQKRASTDSVSGEILKDYVQCHNFEDYQEFFYGFEKVPNPKYGSWSENVEMLVDHGYESNRCMAVTFDKEFPCTYELSLKELEKKPTGVVITGMFYSPSELRKMCFVLSCHDKDGQYFGEIFKVSKKLKGDALNKWTRVSCKVTLPDNLSEDDKLKIFVWNPNNGQFLFDDFSFIFY